VALRGLVLLDVVHQDLQAAVDAAVVQVEPEPPDLNRLAAAFVLPGVDARPDQVKDLVVAREQRPPEHLFVAPVQLRLHRRGSDDDALVENRDRRLLGFLRQRGAERRKNEQAIPMS
jgi:hypothetical protein